MLVSYVVPTHVGVNRDVPDGQSLRAGVVPTHVGVNRTAYDVDDRRRSCPHTRGGEPTSGALVVPTHVGVNRSSTVAFVPTHVGVNRSAPAIAGCRSTFSPHTWG